MRRRNTGYVLLALLVVTGLAGTISGSISGKERKAVISLMKETRGDVLKSTKGLSEAQLDFKASADQWSAKECVYHIAVSENNLWQWLEAALKSPANPEKRSEIKTTDEEIIKMTENRSNKVKTSEQLEPKSAPYKSLDDALADFKDKRAKHIQYLKVTTEDLRDHIVQGPFGWIDCYQLCLLIAAHSNRHTQQINEIKTNAAYPK